ncbi:MAG: N-acetyltransferase [Sphingomonadales bacterium]|jgi:hypothetical protein
MSETLKIKKVENKKALKTFVKMVPKFYKNDPHYVQMLDFERMGLLSKEKNPYFLHAKAEYWIAFRGDEPVGRISAQIDQLSLEKIDPKLGSFGMFECENNIATAKALFDVATGWLKSRDMTKVRGPYNLSVNSECGLLVKGFNTDPMVMMGHAPKYYGELFERLGFEKEKDLLAYSLDLNLPWPEKIERILKIGYKNKRVDIRPMDKNNFETNFEIVFDIFNDAWSENWGFLPFTKEEAHHTAKEMKPLIKPEKALFAYLNDKPVGFMITLPNINWMIKDLGGKLFPFGWAKFIWRLFTKAEVQNRVPLMGMRKDVQGSPSAGMMVMMLIDLSRKYCVKNGGKIGELSWILEDNKAMNNILLQIGCIHYKTYRMYGKDI